MYKRQVQNLTKMAQQKGYQYSAEKLEERKYRVLFTLGEAADAPAEQAPVCVPDARTDTVVAISAAVMGDGSEELGKTLLKAFVLSLIHIWQSARRQDDSFHICQRL